MNWPIFFRLNEKYLTFHLRYKHSGTFAKRKYEELSYTKKIWKCDPMTNTSIENATPSQSTQSWKCDPNQRHIQPRPQGFSLKKWVGRSHPFLKGKALGDEVAAFASYKEVRRPAEEFTLKHKIFH